MADTTQEILKRLAKGESGRIELPSGPITISISMADVRAAQILQLISEHFPHMTLKEIAQALVAAQWWIRFLGSVQRDSSPRG